jgi:outer membrane protein TolC
MFGNRVQYRLRLALLLALCVALSLVGCVDQQKEVGVYQAALKGHAPTTTRPAAAPFEADTKLSLTEAMALASRDNEQLALGGEEYLQALIDKDRTFANFLPTITLAPVYFQRQEFSGDKKLSLGPVNAKLPSWFAQTHALDVPFVAEANVFNGFGDVARFKAAGLTSEQRRDLLLDMQSALLLETAQTYYAVLRAEKSVEVLSTTLSVQDSHVQDIRDKLAHGLARSLDLEQSRAQWAATRVQLNEARRAVGDGRAAIARLIGVPYVRASLVDEYPTPKTAGDLEALLTAARQSRQDLKAAREATLAARQGVEAAIAQYYPSVSLNLQGFASKQTWPDDSHFAGLVQLNLPIFDAGRIHADVRTAWSQFRQSLDAESLLNKQVAQQVETALIDFKTSVRQVEDLTTEVGAAQEALRISDRSYNLGLATNLDRLDSQDRLLAAQLELAAENYNTTVRYLAVLRVIGKLDGANAGKSPTIAPTAPATSQPDVAVARQSVPMAAAAGKNEDRDTAHTKP